MQRIGLPLTVSARSPYLPAELDPPTTRTRIRFSEFLRAGIASWLKVVQTCGFGRRYSLGPGGADDLHRLAASAADAIEPAAR